MCSRKTNEEFIEKSKLTHGDIYGYSKVKYFNEATYVTIICPIHGDFEQTPRTHYRSGCKKCAIKNNKLPDTSVNRKTKIEFELQANEVHNNLYDYSKVEYISNKSKVEIGCSKHGYFFQNPKNHLHGQGCPKCVKEMNYFRKSHYTKVSDKSTIYLIKIHNEKEEFYKIGKSIYGATKRFKYVPIPYNFTIIKEREYEIGYTYDLEIKLHKKYREYSYKPQVKFGGYTECFNMLLPIEEIINII